MAGRIRDVQPLVKESPTYQSVTALFTYKNAYNHFLSRWHNLKSKFWAPKNLGPCAASRVAHPWARAWSRGTKRARGLQRVCKSLPPELCSHARCIYSQPCVSMLKKSKLDTWIEHLFRSPKIISSRSLQICPHMLLQIVTGPPKKLSPTTVSSKPKPLKLYNPCT